MQEPKIHPLDLISLCVALAVCATLHAGHSAEAADERVAGGFSPRPRTALLFTAIPGVCSRPRGPRWLPGQPWFSQRWKEARGGGQSVPRP